MSASASAARDGSSIPLARRHHRAAVVAARWATVAAALAHARDVHHGRGAVEEVANGARGAARDGGRERVLVGLDEGDERGGHRAREVTKRRGAQSRHSWPRRIAAARLDGSGREDSARDSTCAT